MPAANGGWQSMATAPRDKPVLLLFIQNEKPTAAVARFTHGRWLVRTPHSDERIEIYARKWCEVPPLPDISSF
jgi:hypothetical protein